MCHTYNILYDFFFILSYKYIYEFHVYYTELGASRALASLAAIGHFRPCAIGQPSSREICSHGMAKIKYQFNEVFLFCFSSCKENMYIRYGPKPTKPIFLDKQKLQFQLLALRLIWLARWSW